jgi:hypothetical protein
MTNAAEIKKVAQTLENFRFNMYTHFLPLRDGLRRGREFRLPLSGNNRAATMLPRDDASGFTNQYPQFRGNIVSLGQRYELSDPFFYKVCTCELRETV